MRQATLSFYKPRSLTPEQRAIAEHPFGLGARVLVNAFAGTGKTTTCKAVIERNAEKRILYCVFNKAMASSAAEFASERVTVSTVHALALAYCKSLAPKASFRAYALPSDCKELYALWRGQQIELGQAAAGLWDEMREGAVPYPTHQAYYHAFRIEPERTAEWLDAAYDLLICDEAQDTDAGLCAVLQHVQKPMLLVGDIHQDLYKFRDTVDALTLMRSERAASYELTQSFRFGPEVAQLANQILGLDRLVGLGSTQVRRGTVQDALRDGPCTLLCRTNIQVFEAARRAQCSLYIVGNVFQTVRTLMELEPAAVERRRQKAQQEQDDQLVASIDLLKVLSIDDLTQLERRVVKPAVARLTLSTVHSCKGLEWARVVLDPSVQSDTALYYVGVTRAKRQLYY